MSFELFRDSQQGAGFVVCVVTIPLCIFATIRRFAGTYQSTEKGKGQWENWFALLALGFHLAYAITFLYLLLEMNGKTLMELALEPPEKLINIMKVGWVMTTHYCPNQLFAKLSLCLLYHRIFSANRTLVIWLYVVAGVQTVWFFGSYITKWLMCVPVERVWDLTGNRDGCINVLQFMAVIETVNSLLDFIMIGLAIWIIRSLRMDSAIKRKLAVLFTIGGLSGVIGLIKVGLAGNAAFASILNPIWDLVQMATTIICCCAPVYRSVFPPIDFRRLRSTITSYGLSRSTLRSRKSHASAGDSAGKSSHSHVQNSTDWMRLDGTSEENAWTKVSAAPTAVRPKGSRDTSDSSGGFPMMTMEVEQTVTRV